MIATPGKKWPLWAGLVAMALVVASGGMLWRRHVVVAANLPARPSLQGWPADFADRVEEAENDAFGYFHTGRGLIALSRLYHINGFYNPALSCYDGLRALQPKTAKWWHLEATIVGDFGQAADAVPLYREAFALDPGYQPSRIKLGEILLKNNRSEEASEVFKGALQKDANNPYALWGLAQIASAKRNWVEARKCLDTALQVQPDFAGALSLLITIDEKTGDQAGARAARETLGSQEFVDIPDPWAFDLYSDCYDAYRLSVAATTQRFAKNYAGAIRLFEQAIRVAPRASAYERELGVLLADMERYEEARPHAQRATELAPTDPYTWTLLVRVLTGTKENEAAWRALSEGLSRCPNSQDLHLARGHRLLESQRYAEAIAEFKETHRLWPSEATPLIEMAQACFSLGEEHEAMSALYEALERQPGSPAALTILAVHAIDSGDRHAASTAYHQLEEHAGAVGPVLSRLQQSYQSKFGEPLP
ncbi:MAG TPA: tetratricopeptide repeat protein [Opitutaceae bacterium]